MISAGRYKCYREKILEGKDCQEYNFLQVVRKGLSNTVVFEQRPKGNKGMMGA